MHRGCCISCTCARTRDLPKVFPSFTHTHTHTHTHTGETHSFNAASGILSISRTTACVPNMLFPSYPSRCHLRASFAHSWRSLATRACVTRTNDSVYVANSPRVIVVTAEWNRFLQTHNETGGGGASFSPGFPSLTNLREKLIPPIQIIRLQKPTVLARQRSRRQLPPLIARASARCASDHALEQRIAARLRCSQVYRDYFQSPLISPRIRTHRGAKERRRHATLHPQHTCTTVRHQINKQLTRVATLLATSNCCALVWQHQQHKEIQLAPSTTDGVRQSRVCQTQNHALAFVQLSASSTELAISWISFVLAD